MTLNRSTWLALALLAVLALASRLAAAQEPPSVDYRLAAGDAIRIQVFQNPDLTLETRLSESGAISYPLIGSVPLAGATIGEAEQAIARALRDGGFVKSPQVTVLLVQVRGNQVSVLGLVGKPGRYPIETAGLRISELIALAGGVAATGADVVVLTGIRDGKPFRREVDLPSIFLDGQPGNDVPVAAGDTIYVHRAPSFYIYGEVQRPGAYRVERRMSIRQALVTGGGPSLRGTERRLRLHRRAADGSMLELVPELSDPILADDVLFVRESWF